MYADKTTSIDSNEGISINTRALKTNFFFRVRRIYRATK